MLRFGFWKLFLAFCVVELPRFSYQRRSPGYVHEYGEYTYKFVLGRDDERTWLEAEERCKGEMGHLASLITQDEIQWVTDIIMSLTSDYKEKGRFWLGGIDLRITSLYEWVDGLPFKRPVAPWAPGEPNRPLDVDYNFCVAMAPRRGLNSTWSDEDCYNAYGYICKTHGTPVHMSEDRQRYGYKFETQYFVYKIIPLVDDHMTWSESDFYCKEAERGRLASFFDTAENQLMTKWLKLVRWFHGYRNYWIGATNLGHELLWEWSDSTETPYTAWAKGEPSKYTADNRKKHCATINTAPLWGQWTTESCVYQLPFICKSKKCLGKTDLAFIVDASGSVTKLGFAQAKEFIWSVVKTFHISNKDTRVGLIRYSTHSSVIFNFQKFTDIRLMKKAIYAMDWTEGGTRTEAALNQALTDLYSDRGGDRPNVPNVLILLTDGKSENPRGVGVAAKALRDKAGVNIVAVGIGNQIDMRELRSVATTNNDVINVRSYGVLKRRVGQIRERVCDEMIQAVLREKAEAERKRKEEAAKANAKNTTEPAS